MGNPCTNMNSMYSTYGICEELVTVTGGPMQRITAAGANIRTFDELLSMTYKS
jgi:hypothetical protein